MKKTEASLSWFDKIIYKEKLIYFSRGIRSCYPYILVVYAYQFTQTHTWIGQSWLMVQGVDMVFIGGTGNHFLCMHLYPKAPSCH